MEDGSFNLLEQQSYNEGANITEGSYFQYQVHSDFGQEAIVFLGMDGNNMEVDNNPDSGEDVTGFRGEAELVAVLNIEHEAEYYADTAKTDLENGFRRDAEIAISNIEHDAESDSTGAAQLDLLKINSLRNDIADIFAVTHDHNFAKTLKPRSKSKKSKDASNNNFTSTEGLQTSTPQTETVVSSNIPLNYALNVVGGFQAQEQNTTGGFFEEYHNPVPAVQIRNEVKSKATVVENMPGVITTEEPEVPLNVCQEEIIQFHSQELDLKNSDPTTETKAQKLKCYPQKNTFVKPKPPAKSLLKISVPGGYIVQMQRYIYPQSLCRVCLLSKKDMVYLFEEVNITGNGLVENSKGPTSSNRYNLRAAIKTLLDIDILYGDSLPDHICNDCLDKLMLFSVFRKQISLAQNALTTVIEQVKYTMTPTVIPSALGQIDASKIEIYRHAESIAQVQKMFKNSGYVHNVNRYLPDRAIEKMFSIFTNAVGLKSEKLSCLKKYALEPPYVNGWFCSTCGLTVRGNTEQYIQHFFDFHHVEAENVRFPCDICGDTFLQADTSGISHNYADHWIQHFFFHHCDECKKPLPSQKAISVHKQSAHKDTSSIFTCTICAKKFHKRSHLSAHLKTHLNPEQRKPFLNWCKICGKGLSSSLKAHTDSIHNTTRLWKCNICVKDFKRKEALISHRATHKNIAGEITSTHILPLPYCIKKGDLKHNCQICQERFPTAGELQIHGRFCHPPSSGIGTRNNTKHFGSLKPSSDDLTPHKCPHVGCSKEIRMRSNYLKHLRVHKRRQETGKEEKICVGETESNSEIAGGDPSPTDTPILIVIEDIT